MIPAIDPAMPSRKGNAAAWWGGVLGAAATAALSFVPAAFPAAGTAAKVLGLNAGQPVSEPMGFAAGLAIGVAGVWAALTIAPARRLVPLLGAAGILTFSQSLVLALQGWQWEPWPALLALVAGSGAALLLRGSGTGAAAFFQGRLAPTRLLALSQAGDLSFLGPDQRDATVLTCRLLNENALRERLPAPDFLKLCASFRTKASALLLQHGACLDPAEPNGVRAFFGLPFATAAPADEAVQAALELDAAMQDFFAAVPLSTDGLPPEVPVCGIGLATGTLTAGLTGSTYTVLGDAVELSRWLAVQNSHYQTRLLLDASTHFAADKVEDRPLEFINPPDGAAVEIFQLLGTTGSLLPEALARRNAFRDAIMLLRAGHAGDAAGRFGDARRGLITPDPVLEYFVSLAHDQTQRDAASHGLAPHPSSPPTVSAPMPTSPPATPTPASRRSGKAGRKLPRRP